MLKGKVQYRNHETLHVCKKQTTQEGRGGGRVRETEAGSRLPGITDVGFFCCGPSQDFVACISRLELYGKFFSTISGQRE